MMPAMRAVVLVLALGLAGGCVTGNQIVKLREPSVPTLVVTTALDLLVIGLVSSQVDGFTTGAIIASTLAGTAADVAVGCILGACAPLRP